MRCIRYGGARAVACDGLCCGYDQTGIVTGDVTVCDIVTDGVTVCDTVTHEACDIVTQSKILTNIWNNYENVIA